MPSFFKYLNATDSLKATRAILTNFLGLNENFTELKSCDKILFWQIFVKGFLPPILHLMGVQGWVQ